MPDDYDSFELLLDTPDLVIALIDGTLWASTMHAELSPAEIGDVMDGYLLD